MRHTAIVDLGSNSFRLVVYGWEPGRYWHHVDEIREAVRIREGAAPDGTLRREPLDRALRTAKLFGAFCRATDLTDVTAVATSAIRDAPNRDELLAAIRVEAGLDVRVLSEREEAWYGYLAIANSTTLSDGFGFDLGGGSVQVTRVRGRQMTEAASWPLGTVRTTEAFLPGGKASGNAIEALRTHALEALRSAPWVEPRDGGRAVGIGGTIRNLAAAAEKRAGLSYTDAQGYRLTRDQLSELIETLAALPPGRRGKVGGIKPDRGDVILAGAVVLDALMEATGVDAVEATDAGLREGLFFERYLEGRDPPLFDDVRRASVEALAHRYEQTLGHSRHVAALATQIYDRLADEGLVEASADDRELLWAACMLHDIGTAVDYDDHHKHSRYLILNAGLPGFTARELELVALIARYHRKGDPDASELGDLAERGDDARLELLAGIIRLCEQLERSRDGSVADVVLDAEDGALVMRPRTSADASVALWSARRSADLLARALNRRIDIVG